MNKIILAQLLVVLAVAARAADVQPVAASTAPVPAPVVAGPAEGTIAVGDIFTITLPCNPTTGFQWDVKSINRKIALPKGPVTYHPITGTEGLMGAGGRCTLDIEGKRPGKTKVVLIYQRSWEKGKKPAETFKATLTVVAKKAS